MGLGDDIMLTAKAKSIKEKTGKKIRPLRRGSLEWSIIYENNPNFSKVKDKETIDFEILPRPYLNGTGKDSRGSYVNYVPLYPKPGEFFFSPSEIQYVEKKYSNLPQNFVTIEPYSKTRVFSTNRDWGFEKFQQIINHFAEINFVQFHQPGITKPLHGKNVIHITESVRIAFLVLSKAKFHIGNDGGTIHAATALGKKCIAIYSGLAGPQSVGYDININFHVEHSESPCGRQYECKHCRWTLEQIKVEDVIQSIEIVKKETFI